MKLQVLNSNSKGNAYILGNDKEALLIECGVHIRDIKEALSFNLLKVAGCLVTHEHKDHCVSVKDIMNSGIEVWSSYGTHKAMGTEGHHRARMIHVNSSVKIGSFLVKAYDVKHDCAQPFCYLIHHPECGTVLFLTDSYYCEYNFHGLDHVIIEANYCQSILDKRLQDGASPLFLRDRVITSHMSLATCKMTLQAYDLSRVKNIVLIHLSDGNSDENRFRKEVQEATGKLVHVARAGVTIDFGLKPY